MGKLMDPEEAAADSSSGGGNATGGGEHVVILDAGDGGKKAAQQQQQRKRLRVEEEDEAPVRSEGEVSGQDARTPQETMEAVLLRLPALERASMGIDDLHAVSVNACGLDLVWFGY